MLGARYERGDTIIEVLFAFTVFSLIAVAGLSLMNQGTALAQRALEISLVRQQIDSQADALRYLNRAYVDSYGKGGAPVDLWNRVVFDHKVEGRAQNFNEIADAKGCHIPNESFALDVKKLTGNPLLIPRMSYLEDMQTYAKVNYEYSEPRAEGLWVQAVRSGGGDERPGFYDFHIRACWFTPGQSTPVTLGTIVRLYEPR